MTPVRQVQDSGTGKKAPTRKKAKVLPPKVRAGKTAAASASTESQIAQVRLQADELLALREAMRQLNLTTTSEALREAIRLLVRQAREDMVAEEIENFYPGGRAPLPDGVVPATEAELAAADASEW